MPVTEQTPAAGLPVAIAILAKAPVSGYAKTRLIPTLGAEGAAAVQAAMLERSLATALAAGIGPVTLWCAPDRSHPAFASAAAQGVELAEQPAGDIGQRMLAAMSATTAAGGVIVIGTDCPALTPAHLRQAAAALAGQDAVVIPAEDGGYVLLGLRQANAAVFAGVAWSTPQVMAQTRARLAAAGLRHAEFTPLFDVDRSSDLPRIYALMPDLARRTCSA
ncbi:TIGR04282 family arsenosugar biosynthesis glycosyltransferase [Dechloromonas sp.]|uniref:TIGR04282 family arsenosugar biosynthesis glycosyltransferase n=1 Tax=Dechloromonas sp. TaxID=1917218 RepID=UPI002170F994|nr:TIGR04282 family arsenosugar biosynthesis glycosyltransferase [Dechloromonas sp.]MBU3696372.1 glycosyltransferase [Dechloromonas sp.]